MTRNLYSDRKSDHTVDADDCFIPMTDIQHWDPNHLILSFFVKCALEQITSKRKKFKCQGHSLKTKKGLCRALVFHKHSLFSFCNIVIDCMMFNAIFNRISVISQRPVHLSILSWCSFNQYSAQYSFQATGCFPTYRVLLRITHTFFHL